VQRVREVAAALPVVGPLPRLSSLLDCYQLLLLPRMSTPSDCSFVRDVRYIDCMIYGGGDSSTVVAADIVVSVGSFVHSRCVLC
jgi:hypothetical protein